MRDHMSIFYLPDLGEGLLDAEIHELFVKVGDKVEAFQPMVAMETAKAVVDVPAPQAGVIVELFGKPKDIIKTGAPLVKFADSTDLKDQGTVVGKLEEQSSSLEEGFIVGTNTGSNLYIRATPQVRLLAKKLNVDLNNINGTGPKGLITKEDIKAASKDTLEAPQGYKPLRGVRRAMLQSMVLSHQQVVPVTIFDEVDIDAWAKDSDITIRLLKAIVIAVKKEPSLNAWFDESSYAVKYCREVNIGLAMDSEDGLFVPVIPNVQQKSFTELRKLIESYKKSLHARSLGSDTFKDATIVLSNFGKFSGKFASPIIVPPTVAILGVGKIFDAVVPFKGKPAIHKLIPLSLTFDHRAITGGEATRFLGALLAELMKPTLEN